MSKAKIGFLVGAAVVALSAQVQAAGCAGAGAEATIATGSFIVNSFKLKCSNNVFLAYAETSTAVGVCAGSKKGNKTYGGSSEGGAVKEAKSETVTQAPGVDENGCS